MTPTPPRDTPGKSRVFILDDHTMFREGLRQLIEHDPGLTVCGDAETAGQAIESIQRTRPDVVIVDITLADSSGLDFVKMLRSGHEDLPGRVVSMHEESLYAERALRAGAMGYVMKNEPAKTVTAAIHSVLRGEVYLSRKMSSSMISKFMRGESDEPKSPLTALSDRELEVFRMLGQGKGTRQIAQDLNVSIPTVQSFRNRIKEKLNLKTAPELVLRAIHWVQSESGR
ncbi:MAG TPA: response regulator transcription factor [Verrucomicrobiae bacterium]|nr:response regulator transcription factor [Verrucomicrobiae bacterium]